MGGTKDVRITKGSPMNRFLLWPLALCLVTLLHVLGAGPLLAADRPNFVWILSEDNSKHYLKLFDPQPRGHNVRYKLITGGYAIVKRLAKALGFARASESVLTVPRV